MRKLPLASETISLKVATGSSDPSCQDGRAPGFQKVTVNSIDEHSVDGPLAICPSRARVASEGPTLTVVRGLSADKGIGSLSPDSERLIAWNGREASVLGDTSLPGFARRSRFAQ